MRYALKQHINYPTIGYIPAGTTSRETSSGTYTFGKMSANIGFIKDNPDWFEKLPETGEITIRTGRGGLGVYDQMHVKAEYPVRPEEAFRKEDRWWNMAKSVFIVEFIHNNPHQVRIWTKEGKEGETKDNTYRGQFHYRDARFMALNKMAIPIQHTYWTPMADGAWDVDAMEPLIT